MPLCEPPAHEAAFSLVARAAIGAQSARAINAARATIIALAVVVVASVRARTTSALDTIVRDAHILLRAIGTREGALNSA